MLQLHDGTRERLRSWPSTTCSAESTIDSGWLRWLLFLTIAGYLLLAHGCHSDKDTELRTRFMPLASIQDAF